jgi:hypothetical protein
MFMGWGVRLEYLIMIQCTLRLKKSPASFHPE